MVLKYPNFNIFESNFHLDTITMKYLVALLNNGQKFIIPQTISYDELSTHEQRVLRNQIILLASHPVFSFVVVPCDRDIDSLDKFIDEHIFFDEESDLPKWYTTNFEPDRLGFEFLR